MCKIRKHHNCSTHLGLAGRQGLTEAWGVLSPPSTMLPAPNAPPSDLSFSMLVAADLPDHPPMYRRMFPGPRYVPPGPEAWLQGQRTWCESPLEIILLCTQRAALAAEVVRIGGFTNSQILYPREAVLASSGHTRH